VKCGGQLGHVWVWELRWGYERALHRWWATSASGGGSSPTVATMVDGRATGAQEGKGEGI
jgi:hypothetical protein